MKILNEKSSKVEEAVAMNTYVRKHFPQAAAMVGKVSAALEWDIVGAMSFCVNLLTDVNAHEEAREVQKYFLKQTDKWGM